jgi:pimeloyl-ACP methyl ester carboxylesterase
MGDITTGRLGPVLSCDFAGAGTAHPVCTYDRAGDGLSDARPASVRPLTGATQARELHTLLQVVHARPPYVLVGHSYGGMITRQFAARYRHQVAGMVLLDASSEPEVAVYDRLPAPRAAGSPADLTPARHRHSPTSAGPREATRLSPANASAREPGPQ